MIFQNIVVIVSSTIRCKQIIEMLFSNNFSFAHIISLMISLFWSMVNKYRSQLKRECFECSRPAFKGLVAYKTSLLNLVMKQAYTIVFIYAIKPQVYFLLQVLCNCSPHESKIYLHDQSSEENHSDHLDCFNHSRSAKFTHSGKIYGVFQDIFNNILKIHLLFYEL